MTENSRAHVSKPPKSFPGGTDGVGGGDTSDEGNGHEKMMLKHILL